jgi:heme a synthase
MDAFRRLCIASTVATITLVSIGGLVRATKSGLGCGTDWPHCSGRLVPALANRALVIEYSHRLAALVLVVLLGTLAVTAVRNRRSAPKLVGPSLAAFGLVLFQAVLGAMVVWLELRAGSVVLHLSAALALLALLIGITARSYAATGRLQVTADPSLAGRAWFAAASVLLVLLVGSYVTGRDAGLAFTDWPLMGGELFPSLSVAPQAIHWLHRVLAAVGAVIVALVCVPAARRRPELPLQARLAHAVLGLVAIEILIGGLNVWTRLNPLVVTSHLLVGALIWSGLVALAVVSRPLVEVEERRVLAEGPALETVR